MMTLRIIPALLIIVLTLAACGPNRADVDAMAEGMCACMQPMAEALAAVQRLAGSSGDAAALEQAMARLEAASGEVEQCMETLEATYGEALIDAEAGIRAAMAGRCPDVARAMEQADPGF